MQKTADELNAWLDSEEGKVGMDLLRVYETCIILFKDSKPVAGFLPAYLLTKDGLQATDVPHGEWTAYAQASDVAESDMPMVSALEVLTSMVNDAKWTPSYIIPAIRKTLDCCSAVSKGVVSGGCLILQV
jgi:hypothetical protein